MHLLLETHLLTPSRIYVQKNGYECVFGRRSKSRRTLVRKQFEDSREGIIAACRLTAHIQEPVIERLYDRNVL